MDCLLRRLILVSELINFNMDKQEIAHVLQELLREEGMSNPLYSNANGEKYRETLATVINWLNPVIEQTNDEITEFRRPRPFNPFPKLFGK